jgi:ribosomal protein S18 acetylase RimI-like enzyme
MEYSFDLCRQKGNVWLSDDGNACALLLYPDRKGSAFDTAILNLQLVLRCTGLAGLQKTMGREARIQSVRPTGRICYLWFIGVDPLCQGNGTGGLLLEEVLRECASTQRPVYLETSVQQNIAWYERYGFTRYHAHDYPGYTLSFLKQTRAE